MVFSVGVFFGADVWTFHPHTQGALRAITDDEKEERHLFVQAACPSQLVAAHLFLGDSARALSAVDRV